MDLCRRAAKSQTSILKSQIKVMIRYVLRQNSNELSKVFGKFFDSAEFAEKLFKSREL